MIDSRTQPSRVISQNHHMSTNEAPKRNHQKSPDFHTRTTIPAPYSSLLPPPIWLRFCRIQYDRSYPRSAVTKAQVTAGVARVDSLDGLPNPGKSSWSVSRSTNITKDVWKVDDMADILYDSDRSLSPQKHRQAPRTGRYFPSPFKCICG